MENNTRFRSTLIIFYALVGYVFLFFVWWTYCHYYDQTVIFNLEIESELKQFKMDGLELDIKESPMYTRALKKYWWQVGIITASAALFFSIFIFGAYWIHRQLRQEIAFNQRQHNFILSITHELKSPLAGIILALETLVQRELPRAQQIKFMNGSLKEAARLRELVENILMAAKIEEGKLEFERHDINISQLATDIAQRQSDLHGQNRRFSFQIQDNLWVSGDKTALTSVITNLMENAVKYTHIGDEIALTISENPQNILLSVADTGIGIADSEKGKIFDKFYRVGNEDTRIAKGTGLGLFLVKQLIDLQGGTIKVSNNQPKGTVFGVQLPLAQYRRAPQPTLVADSAFPEN